MTERYKGHDQLLEAMTTLPDARLVVAGDGDDRRRLEEKAAALGLGDRTFFTGFLSEATLAELYRRCAAFVMPSRGEGFGLVYLEAMRAGKPVLAARGSAAEEIVRGREDRAARGSRRPGGAAGRAGPAGRRSRRGPEDGRGGPRTVAEGVRDGAVPGAADALAREAGLLMCGIN